MALTKAALILAIVVIIDTIDARDIPEFLHICKAKDRNFEPCVVESIEYLKMYLRDGVPEYNIPSLEPLKLNLSMIDPTKTLRVRASNLNVFGASDFYVKRLKIDLNKQLFLVDIALPNIRVEGRYNIDGRLLLFPIRGSGPLFGNFSDATGACRIQGQKYHDARGMEKIRITDFKLKVSVGKGSLKLDNLFNGEEVLGNVVNSAINNNFDVFLNELLPIVEKALSEAFRDIAGSIVEQFSYAQLFPEA